MEALFTTRRRLFSLSPRHNVAPNFTSSSSSSSSQDCAVKTAAALEGNLVKAVTEDNKIMQVQVRRELSKNGAGDTYKVVLPEKTPWSWAIVVAFHVAERRIHLSQNTQVTFHIRPDVDEYSVVRASTSTKVASGRVEVMQWAAMTTKMYGRKRGTWWLKEFDAKESKCWSLKHSSPAARTQSLPPGVLLLQEGLRNKKRQFVAMECFTMADVLAFALLHSIFADSSLEKLVNEQVPDVICWFSRTQRQLLSSVHQGNVSSTLHVQCLRASPADRIVPLGCGTYSELPKWNSAADSIVKNGPSLPILEWRSEPKSSNVNNTKKRAAQISDAIDKVSSKLDAAGLLPKSVPVGLNPGTVASAVDWDALPKSLDPEAMMEGQRLDQRGRSCSVRVGRKRAQIESMIALILPLLPDHGSPATAVEFAAGSGYIGLVLAALRPSVTVYIMDRAPVSIGYARDRAARAGLSNVRFSVCDIRDFKLEDGETYDVGFALHACGEASDYALDHCVSNKAAYVLAPCCAGFIQNSAGNPSGTGAGVERPTSVAMRDACVTREEYLMISAGADHSGQAGIVERGQRAMSILDLDRNLRAREVWCRQGEKSEMSYHRMYPATCTPKNQILVGKIIAMDQNNDEPSTVRSASASVSASSEKPTHGGYPTRKPTAEEWVEVPSKKTLDEVSEQSKTRKKKGSCNVQ